MRRAAIGLPVLLLCGVLPAVWWFHANRLERSQDERIREAARSYGLDPALVKAVVWRESRFDPLARGAAGEIGLMQLQAVAAQEWADAERVSRFTHEQCLDARTNLLAGAFYLSTLLRRYNRADDAVPYALADYNAGRRNVLNWMGGEGLTNSDVFIRQIGFPGTRRYVEDVMKRARRYRESD